MRSPSRAVRRDPASREPVPATAAPAQAAQRPPRVRFQFFRDVVGELRKVTWPTRDDVTRLTMLVAAMSVAIGALLGLLDYAFTEIVRLMLSLGR